MVGRAWVFVVDRRCNGGLTDCRGSWLNGGMTNAATAPKTCRKCGGSGYLPHFARIDAGRCWACTGLAAPLSAEVLADDEAYLAELAATREAARLRRAARRAARVNIEDVEAGMHAMEAAADRAQSARESAAIWA